MSISELLTGEFQHEVKTTRKLLERVPHDKLDWKPHEKSMSLGQLAKHIPNLLGTWLKMTLTQDGFDMADSQPLNIEGVEAILEVFDRNVAGGLELLQSLSDESLSAPWRLSRAGQTILEMPRYSVLRTMIFNHIIHHRGQLSVYLRLLDVPLPSIYGPTADEPMF